jgi:hypothetical protein
MKQILFLIIAFFCLNASAQKPRVFVIDADHLVTVKNKLKKKDQPSMAVADSLKKKADGLLNMKLLSVMDKAFTPVSGNKHDYMSQAPYFWYDSSKPDGKPYLRRDGEHNPEIKKITDRTYIGELESATRILSLAYYLTRNEKYAAKAATLIRHWFLDDGTKMNPNLEYAQGIPGITNGRGIGIIESRTLTGIADAIGLLHGSKAWTKKDDEGMREWYDRFLNWMLTSKNGKDEHAAKNNHGTWYYMQVVDFALFTGDKQKAKALAVESKKLLDSQLTAAGNFPLELERTNALGYSSFNTLAWLQTASLAQQTGVDLWKFRTSKNAGLQNAVDWLMPFALKEEKWNYKQIGNYNSGDFYPVLMMAYKKYHNAVYLEKALKLEKTGVDPLQILLYK